jgi:hypothetical protein
VGAWTFKFMSACDMKDRTLAGAHPLYCRCDEHDVACDTTELAEQLSAWYCVHGPRWAGIVELRCVVVSTYDTSPACVFAVLHSLRSSLLSFIVLLLSSIELRCMDSAQSYPTYSQGR